jgi:hypothetical protein
MASTRSIRKRALKMVRDGNAVRWFMKAARARLKAKHAESLKACNWPESVAAALREVDQP